MTPRANGIPGVLDSASAHLCSWENENTFGKRDLREHIL